MIFSRIIASLFLLFIGQFALAEIRVTDDLGQTFVFDKPVQRIISLAPNTTESLFVVGAGDQIVGVDEYSNYPEQAKQITRVNNYAAANYELILSLKPDLVVAWYSGNGDQIIQRLRKLGLPVFVIDPHKVEQIPQVLIRFGALTGHDETAAKMAAEFENKLHQLHSEYLDKKKVTVFYQIWNQPLITLNGKHLVSDVLKLCGGINVFANAIPLVPYVNMEGVIKADPEVIIASGSSGDSPAWLDMWQQWPKITAVANKQVYFIPPDLMQTHSVRILAGASLVCEYLENARHLHKPEREILNK